MTRISYSLTLVASIALLVAIGFFIDKSNQEERIPNNPPDQSAVSVSDSQTEAIELENTIVSPPEPMTGAERMAFLQALLDSNSNSDDTWTDVPDLRYYLNPLVIESMRGFNEDQLLYKINEEHSAEAAYWLAMNYLDDEESHVMLMLTAAGFSQKPGPVLDAINGCCSFTLGDPESERAAAIKREALTLIARETGLPSAAEWPEFELDPDIANEVFAQRARYMEEINRSAMLASGQRWIE